VIFIVQWILYSSDKKKWQQLLNKEQRCKSAMQQAFHKKQMPGSKKIISKNFYMISKMIYFAALHNFNNTQLSKLYEKIDCIPM
jgi:hypothetical protein